MHKIERQRESRTYIICTHIRTHICNCTNTNRKSVTCRTSMSASILVLDWKAARFTRSISDPARPTRGEEDEDEEEEEEEDEEAAARGVSSASTESVRLMLSSRLHTGQRDLAGRRWLLLLLLPPTPDASVATSVVVAR